MPDLALYLVPLNDDDEYSFEDEHAELASELREYSDDEDDEFDEDERAAVTIMPPAQPIGPRSFPSLASRQRKPVEEEEHEDLSSIVAEMERERALVMAAGLGKSSKKAAKKQTASADDDWEPPASAAPKKSPPAKKPAVKAPAKKAPAKQPAKAAPPAKKAAPAKK